MQGWNSSEYSWEAEYEMKLHKQEVESTERSFQERVDRFLLLLADDFQHEFKDVDVNSMSAHELVASTNYNLGLQKAIQIISKRKDCI